MGRLDPIAVIPIILSGGSGTRLWPYSRSNRPKQFLNLDSELNFFQATLKRCQSKVFDNAPIVVAANDHRFLVAESMTALECKGQILLEPVPRNSCAAVIAGCLQARERNPEAVVAIMAADHLIRDTQGFADTIDQAVSAGEADKLVTFGIEPTKAATGYGYINASDTDLSEGNWQNVIEFVEKPDQASAEKYVSKGYFWNSGNFLFRAETLLKEAKRHVPDILESVERSFQNGTKDLDFFRLDQSAFDACRSISLDYAIMEKTDRAVMVRAWHDWTDIGTWESVWENSELDRNENSTRGKSVVLNSRRNLIQSEKVLTTLLGVNDLVVVATTDAVLVADRRNTEAVKDLVENLSQRELEEATQSRKEYRPWGNYDVLDTGTGYKVKCIEIMPAGVLSLQKHQHRSEHWVLVRGELEITLGKRQFTLNQNESVYIPKGELHRISNHTDKLAVLIEVQTGDILDENDIERFEDKYNRSK